MDLQVLLSTMNLKNKKLDKMNITSKCIVIDQCGKKGYEKYKNFDIYHSNEIGVANSRNNALDEATEDIIIFCDDDVIYNKNYKKIILNEFKKNSKADLIFFNFKSLNKDRPEKQNKKNKKLSFYNILKYGTYTLAVKRNLIINNNIRFDTNFGGNSKYGSGEDTLFIVDCYRHKFNMYASTKYIGTVSQKTSTWFNGYDAKYFFDKGALYTAISKKYRKLLCLQYLLRHKEVLKNIKFKTAYKLMKDGCKAYLLNLNYNKFYKIGD